MGGAKKGSQKRHGMHSEHGPPITPSEKKKDRKKPGRGAKHTKKKKISD